jgi:hypothetical protein
MLSTVTFDPVITQMPLPAAILPLANSLALPPDPQMVRLLADQVVTSPRYSPASILMTSPDFAALAAALGTA